MTTQTRKSRTGSDATGSSANTTESSESIQVAKTQTTPAANTATTKARGPTVIDYRVTNPEASGVFFDPIGDEDEALRSLKMKYGKRLVWFAIRNRMQADG